MPPRRKRSSVAKAKDQRARNRKYRASLTEEELLLRRKEDAESQKQRRAQLPEEELARRRREDAENARRRRALLSEAELALRRKQNSERQRQRRTRSSEEEMARSRRKNEENLKRRQANETEELTCLHRVEDTVRSKHLKLKREELTLATEKNNPDVQTLLQIKRLKISVTSLKKAAMELVKSCAQSAVSAIYGSLNTSEQKRRQLKKLTVGKIFKKRRPDKNSYNEIFPIPFLTDSRQFICIVCNTSRELNNPRSVKCHLSSHTISELSEAKEKHTSANVMESRKLKIKYMVLTIYKCELCSDECNNLVAYKKHIMDKHGENREFLGKVCFLCSFCDAIFYWRWQLLVHQRDFHNIFTQCPICNLNVETQELFSKHLDETHSNCFKKDQMILDCADGFFCKICGFCSRSFRRASAHSEEAHSQNILSHPCHGCPQKFDGKKSLKRHMLRVHEEKSFCCELCGKQFKNGKSLSGHMRTHTTQSKDKDRVECKQCGKTFANKDTYKVHYLAAHEKKRVACNICAKTFTTGANLSQHKMLVCEKEKAIPRSCLICRKVFDNYLFLFYHKTNIHKYGNAEENVCHLCKKTLKDAFGLYSHNRLRHTHKSKSNPIQLLCAICQKTCPSKMRLLIHWRMHREEKPYKCNLCDTAFRYPYQFYAHRKNEHADEVESAKIIIDTEMDNKIKEAWKNAHATLLAELKDRIRNSRAATLEDTPENITTHPKNSSANGNQNGESTLLTDNLENNKDVALQCVQEQSSETTKNNSNKSYVDFSRANIPPETLSFLPDDFVGNCGAISTDATERNISEHIPSFQEDSHENEKVNDAFDFDHPPSPTEYSDGESIAEEKPDIYDDPFERRLVVEVERLKECLVCEKYFSELDIYEWHMASKSHRAAMRANKRDAIFIAKNEKRKRKHENENLLEYYEEDENKFLSCPFCNVKLSSLKNYKQHSKQHKQQAHCLLCTETPATIQKLVDHYTKEHDGKNIVKCDVCDEAFLEYREQHLQEHMRDEHDQKQTKRSSNVSFSSCDICGVEIRGKKSLWTHLLSHNDDKYQCLNCNQKFKCLNDLESHFYEVHNGEMPFPCSICPQRFSTEIRLQLHEKEDHSVKHERKGPKTHDNDKKTDQISCPFCDDKFTSTYHYKRHILLQHKKRRNCLLCAEKFATVRHLVDHYISEHGGEKIIKCKICDMGFLEYQSRNLREHLRLTHGGKHPKRDKHTYSCDICGEKTKTVKLLRVHLLSHKDDKHKCVHCDEEFNQSELERHYTAAHNKEIPFSCDECQKKFFTQERLQFHEKEFHPKVNEDQAKYACGECSKAFKSKSELTCHKESHVPIEQRLPYFCEFCGKSFLRPHSLAIHRREHTGEKPYPCTLCDKAFISPGALKLHTNSVHNRKGHSCEVCGKSFNSRKYLIQHTKAKHSSGEQIFASVACEVCLEQFSKPETLKRHVKKHDPSRPFGCDQCSYRFNHKSNLCLHIKGVHEKVATVFPKKRKINIVNT